MSVHGLSKEERILRMLKRVLTDIAKDTHTQPGMKHPLSEHTIQSMRECLALITAREAELLTERGVVNNDRPHFTDEPNQAVLVPVTPIKRKKTPSNDDPGFDDAS